MKDGMSILHSRLMKIFEEHPHIKEEFENDDRYVEERRQFHISQGLDVEHAKVKAYEDYWRMVYKRDGVEFSIRRID